MNAQPILATRNLTKHFPVQRGLFSRPDLVRAVDGVNFTLMPGETLSLVGESGCGKSTTGRLVLKLIEPTAGRIWYRGMEITGMRRRAMRLLRSQMQIIFQDPWSSLNPRLTVGQIIGEGLRREREVSRRERVERVAEIMAKVGLRPEHAQRHPHEFSGGQRQRIGIARALIMKPALVVADEPLSALDVSVQAQVVNLLCRLKEEFDLSYLFISHDLSVVEHLSDRVAVMYLGRLVELGPRRQIFAHPRHPYTQALFSAAPSPSTGPRRQRIILEGDVPSPMRPPSGCHFHPRCPRAKPRCQEESPFLEEGEPGRKVACHFPLT